MTDYLLAAEADKIQDLIFRSAHLREVVGGSQLLTDFCQQMPRELGIAESDIIISDGGSFTLRFRSEGEARTFGARLAEGYRRLTGGTLSVAEPVEIQTDCAEASRLAQQRLRDAKRDLKNRTATSEQIPYAAVCASCGLELSAAYQKLDKNDTQAQYLCKSCLYKSTEWGENRLGAFLQPFYVAVGDPGYPADNVPVPENVGKLDPRNYVAYLVADGNDMGRVFGKCSDCQSLHNLSAQLTEVTRTSLADASQMLLHHSDDVIFKSGGKIPVLPLILGGDDLFALLPAKWALDLTRRFVENYEENLSIVYRNLKLNVPPPTLAAAVVICKATYPYYLAHQRGEELLGRAKQLGKSSPAAPRSTINFEVILGNHLPDEEDHHEYRPTLRPYFAAENGAAGQGIALQRLIDQRRQLKNLPHRRLAQLRSLFAAMSFQDHEQRQKTLSELEKLVERILHVSGYDNYVPAAFEALGGKADLYQVDRPYESSWKGHALPDLLDVWDYAFDLSCSAADYEGDF